MTSIFILNKKFFEILFFSTSFKTNRLVLNFLNITTFIENKFSNLMFLSLLQLLLSLLNSVEQIINGFFVLTFHLNLKY